VSAGVRIRRVRETPCRPEIVIDGRKLLSFSSNDYLGLATHPAVIDAWSQGARQWGVGSGGSTLLSGHTAAHRELEEALADWLGRDRVLLFSNGYMANLSILQSRCHGGQAIVQDRLNHASLYDAARLVRGPLFRYAHAEVPDAARLLARARPATGTLLVTEGIFSMEGDRAPLPELARVARQAGAEFMVDDAHGIGLWGEAGQGTVAFYRLGQDEIPLLMGTFGKAFGTYGAFVAGPDALIETLIQEARPFRYTTALPPALAVATHEALRRVIGEPERRARLHEWVGYFSRAARELGLPLGPSPSPIQPFLIGSSEEALTLSQALEARGIYAPAILPPTVPRGQARLRISLSAAHTQSDLDRLLEALSSLCPIPA
jgi:8-amino-7-oxononanoate synthase